MLKDIKRLSVQTLLFSGLLSAGFAQADVQYRVAYEAEQDEYVVYMKPDSLPEPDLTLSAQVTLAIPHVANRTDFVVSDIQSAIEGVSWQLHSVIEGPVENPQADYLSFGLMINDGTPPAFGWVENEEKRIFSFKESNGCRTGVALLENDDDFNQLPNSVNTNPGNHFMNLGWASANNYLGNYGGSVVCDVKQPDRKACRKADRKMRNIDRRIARLQQKIARLEQHKARLKARQNKSVLRIDALKAKKEAIAEYCPD